MAENNKTQSTDMGFNPGPKLLSWEARDYHPHERGFTWYFFMIFFVVISVYWSLIHTDWGWIPASTILIITAVYFWTHREDKSHEITIYQEGFTIDDGKFHTWGMFKGYWVLYDEFSSILYFQKRGKRDSKIPIQLGHLTRDKIIKTMNKTELTHISDHQEPIIDLWIRALKL